MKALLTPDRYRVAAWLLGLVALVSPLLLVGDPDRDLLAVLLWLAIPNLVAGFVLSWRFTDLPDPLGSAQSPGARRWQAAADRGFIDAAVVLGIQFIGVVIIQLVVSAASGDWDDFFTGPLLITACAGMALCAAVLAGFFVIAPVRMLGSWVSARLSGDRVDSSRPAVALLLLVIVPLALMIVLAGYAVPDVTGAGRTAKGVAGIVLFVQVLFTVQGDAGQQLYAWIARALIVLLVVALVWMVRVALRRRAQKA